MIDVIGAFLAPAQTDQIFDRCDEIFVTVRNALGKIDVDSDLPDSACNA